MTKKTLSFVKGKGSIRHNNRKFTADNVDPNRSHLNQYFIIQPINEAYEQCFGEALAEYNAAQKRADRKKGDYISEIKNSGNGEKVFYETVVQIGTMMNTGVVGEDGLIRPDAMEAAKILTEYVESFKERNPNLYLFNAVLHMDEATPHLHLDYIPVATGYKNGLKVRNSLSKALQNMGLAKSKNKWQNITVAWESREREYLTGLCAERGIEIVVLGEKRPSLSLPEYKQAIHETEELKLENQELRMENDELELENTMLRSEADDIQEMIQKAVVEGQQILEQMDEEQEELKAKTEKQKLELRKVELDRETQKEIKKEVDAELRQAKSQAVEVKGLFQSEPYVKVPQKLWKQMLKAYEYGLTASSTVEKLKERNVVLEAKLAEWKTFKTKVTAFVQEHGLFESLQEYLKPKKKSIHKKLDEHKEKKSTRSSIGTEQKRKRIAEESL